MYLIDKLIDIDIKIFIKSGETHFKQRNGEQRLKKLFVLAAEKRI
jgi:hypothetical protein